MFFLIYKLVVNFIVLFIILYLTSSIFYFIFLAFIGFLKKNPIITPSDRLNNFCVFIPSHNEELLIGYLLKSLNSMVYPKNAYDIFVIADNCSDDTVLITKNYKVKVFERQDTILVGKGFAISWALQKIDLDLYQALIIIDADSIVNKYFLNELNNFINNGNSVIQCYNGVSNSGESWFTKILSVSRNLENVLYHNAKHKLGLSSHLMGNGMCFKADVLKKYGWKAFSSGEDWEYYTNLVMKNEKISFAINARVLHQESKSLMQATPQRLRWSGGRFAVIKRYGFKIFLQGLKTHNWRIIDASFALLFPNYSLLINLTLTFLLLIYFIPALAAKKILFFWLLFLTLLQIFYFFLGICISDFSFQMIIYVSFTPIFLIWKLGIDILGFTGKGTKRWIRTKRHSQK